MAVIINHKMWFESYWSSSDWKIKCKEIDILNLYIALFSALALLHQ